MAFKNKAIQTINSLASENARLKDTMGKTKPIANRKNIAKNISGLQTLRPSLGNQFKKQNYE